MKWREAVLKSLNEYAVRHDTRVVPRQEFLSEELTAIVSAVGSRGKTPHQTLSRILQEFRDEGLIEFLSPGQYLLLDAPISVEAEDLTQEALDIAIRANKLLIGNIETDSVVATVRRRIGQDRVRVLTVDQYSKECAVCDVSDGNLLVASHILRWADSPEHRGNLTNVLCLCKPHDSLFETGYWTLRDDYSLLANSSVESKTIRWLTSRRQCRVPTQFPPNIEFIRAHRQRFGFVV